MPDSLNRTPKPSRLVALVCASVVAAYDQRWLAEPLAKRLGPADVTAETLSRLKGRLLPRLELLVSELHRPGRRRRSGAQEASLRAQLEATRAKLDLAASVIAERGVRNRDLQDRLVAACEDLTKRLGITIHDFCTSLGISERTFRAWRRRPAEPPSEPPAPAPKPRPKRPRNEQRFALHLCPPGLQAMADTTQIRAFGVDLHLVGTQDPGLRHKELLGAFEVVGQESAEIVTRVLRDALRDLPGAQALTDQGTPYIARATQKACEALEVEPLPQVEGKPTDKAPLERAWRTIKGALAPLLVLTDQLAAAVPALRSPELARAVVSLLLGVYLRVYSGGRKHLGHPLDGHDPAALADAVADARERARAEERSRKLFLRQMHAEYNLAQDVSCDSFVRAHRRHSLDDIKAAERILRSKACRCQTRRCDRYFAGILRNVAEHGRARRARDRERRADQRRREAEVANFQAHDRRLAEQPQLRLTQALEALTAQWDEEAGCLAFGGKGWARGTLVRALLEMRARAPEVWRYDVDAAARAWSATTACPQGARIAICSLLEKERAKILHTSSTLDPPPGPATISPKARGKTNENGRPPPHLGLTI